MPSPGTARASLKRLIVLSLGAGLAAAVAAWAVVFGMLRTHPEEFSVLPGLAERVALAAFLVTAPVCFLYLAVRQHR